jgi:osmotically inducible protein OsmC
MASKGKAKWEGDLKGGSGVFTAGEDITGQYSFKSRFEDGPGANPEQLIGAAHAACFSMAFSNGLAQKGTPPTALNTTADVTFQPGTGITGIKLTVRGEVPGISAEDFAAAAADAKAGCPVSKALAGVEITLDAALA